MGSVLNEGCCGLGAVIIARWRGVRGLRVEKEEEMREGGVGVDLWRRARVRVEEEDVWRDMWVSRGEDMVAAWVLRIGVEEKGIYC